MWWCPPFVPAFQEAAEAGGFPQVRGHPDIHSKTVSKHKPQRGFEVAAAPRGSCPLLSALCIPERTLLALWGAASPTWHNRHCAALQSVECEEGSEDDESLREMVELAAQRLYDALTPVH